MSVENQGSTRTELARSFKPDAAARKCSSCWQLASPAPGLQGSGCSQHHTAQGSGHTAPSTPSRPGPDARRDNFNSPATEKLLARGRKAAVQRARIKQKTSNCRAEQDPAKHVGSTFSRSQTSCRHHGSKPSQQFSAAPRQPAPPRKPCCHREGSEELPTLLRNGSSATAAKITG